MNNKVAWIGRIDESFESIAAALDVGIAEVGHMPVVGQVWAVKLNLTYPKYLPGVVNSPTFIEALCRWGRERRVKLIFIEGDGGNGSYSAQETFDGNGVTDLARRYDMRCASVSEKPWEWRVTDVGGHAIRLPYSPFFRRREYDRFVTAPVFKNHIFTIVSLGMKNLWGCIPDPYRMYYHHVLDEGIVALSKELLPDFSVFDGLVALRGRGPMDGNPVDLNAIMVTSDVGTGEVAAVAVMGLALEKIRHLRLARQEGLVPPLDKLVWATDPSPFKRSDFQVERSWLNWLSIGLARIPKLQRAIYHSSLSPAIYGVVNRLRPDSAQKDLSVASAGNRRGLRRRRDV